MAFSYVSTNETFDDDLLQSHLRDFVVLTLELHKHVQIGPCGKSRNDIISFFGASADKTAIERRIREIESSNDPRVKDIIMNEQFLASVNDPTDERGTGMTACKATKVNGKWVFE